MPKTEEEDFVLIESELSGKMTDSGITFDVQIYRGKDEPTWILEVVTVDGTSIVWDERFESEERAMAEIAITIDVEGIETFAPESGQKIH